MDLKPHQNRPVEVIISILFLAVLFLPLLLWTFQQDSSYSEVEKRALKPFPALSGHGSIVDLSRAFDRYFQDHFGLRNWLIHRYQREMKKRFGLSGAPMVVTGLNDWLFFSGDGLLEDLKGQLHFSAAEKQTFGRILNRKQQWLDSKKIAYIFMVAPNKQSIYPEFLPLYYQKLKKNSRLDDLLSGAEGKKLPLLDVRVELEGQKSSGRLYDKSDTHWNCRGALLAYQILMQRIALLFPAFQARENFDFLPQWQQGAGGDLAQMTGHSQSTVEERPVVNTADFTTVHMPLTRELAELLPLPQQKPLYTANSTGQLRVLVLHDSFFNPMIPFTSESFREVLYVWQYHDGASLAFFNPKKLSALLHTFQPDLVIEERLERFLPDFLLSNAWFDEATPSLPASPTPGDGPAAP